MAWVVAVQIVFLFNEREVLFIFAKNKLGLKLTSETTALINLLSDSIIVLRRNIPRIFFSLNVLSATLRGMFTSGQSVGQNAK